MPAKTTHTCYAIGCTRSVSMAHLMCRDHWARVSKTLQRVIWATVRQPSQRVNYLSAVAEAIADIAKADGLSGPEIVEALKIRAGAINDRAQEVIEL